MDKSTSALTLVLADQPDLPVHCVRPQAAKAAAGWFMRNFPGDVLYAVKANPHPAILDAVYAAGVRWFDVASMPEVELVATRFPDARLAFMHPVKARSAIRRAYFDYGVRIFSLDSLDELNKIVAETNGAKDLNLIIRLTVSGDYAQHKLSGKFGAAGPEA
ncbi:MAG: type III PLP-dependent enzyme, partial [Amphiplicatus sp.]